MDHNNNVFSKLETLKLSDPILQTEPIENSLQLDVDLEMELGQGFGSLRLLTDLPQTVLLEICTYLNTKDLINMCLTCRMFYVPAVLELYRKVIVQDTGSAADCTQQTPRNLGTVIKPSGLSKLYWVISSNRNLANYVKCLILNTFKHDMEFVHFVLEGLEIHTLVVYRAPVGFYGFPSSIQTLSIDLNALPTDFYLPSLQNLKVMYDSHMNSNIPKFSDLAHSLIKNNMLINLRQLEFSENKQQDEQLGLIDSLNTLNLGQTNPEPHWLHFFQQFRGKSKLGLISLGIDGYIGKNGQELSALLNEVLQPELLQSLEIKLKELTHPESSHNSNLTSTTFVDNFSLFIPNLRSLGINPTYDCLFCQFESLIRTLSNVQNQIIDLHLSLESLGLDCIYQLDLAIISFQPNIRHLRIIDKARQVGDQTTLFKCMNGNKERFSFYEYGIYHNNLINEFYYGDVLLYNLESLGDPIKRVTNDYSAKFIEESYNYGLNEFMKYYLNIGYSPFVVSGFDLIKKLNKLTYLEMVGIRLRIRRREGQLEVFYESNDVYRIV